jgi:hypothetical protein
MARRKAPGQIAREVVRRADLRIAHPGPPPRCRVDAGTDPYSRQLRDYDFKVAEAYEQIAREAIAAAGFDPDDPIVWAEMVEGILRGTEERGAADEYEVERVYRYSAGRLGLAPRRLRSYCPQERKAWLKVYGRLRQHGGRHRRAPGARPVRYRGSRRPAARRASGVRTGQDPGDGDGPPEHHHHHQNHLVSHPAGRRPVSMGVQLRLGGELPFDPAALAEVPIVERGKLYDALGLDQFQRQAAEEAVRRVIAGVYLKGRGRA